MCFLYAMGFTLCFVQAIYAMDCSKSIDEAINAQAACPFATLPEQALIKIAKSLPCLSDIAHVRQTCKLFNIIFKIPKIKLGHMQPAKNDVACVKEYWERIYSHIIQIITANALTNVGVILDLSGNQVERFMFSKFPACKSVTKLLLIGCKITNERDNFFDHDTWANLEKLDLTRNYLGKRDKDVDSSVDWYSGADIWPSLTALPNLKKLILRENQLSQIPPELYRLTQLTCLDLRDNPLPAADRERLAQKLPTTHILI